METRKRSKKVLLLNRVMALSIFVFCAIYLYQRFQQINSTYTSIEDLKLLMLSARGMLLLFAVMVLTFFNWFIEAKKWKYLLQDFLRISNKTALSSILMGLSVTMVIPYRVGSYIGRVWKFSDSVRLRAVIASIFGGLAQLFVTVMLGLFALLNGVYDLNGIPQIYISSISLIMLILVGVTYFYPGIVISFINNIPALGKLAKAFQVLENFNVAKKLKVVLYSLMRYCIFLVQFYLILTIFSADINFLEMMLPLSLVFLILSIAPTIFFGLGVREFSAILLLTPIIATEEIVLVSSLILWLSNMIIPALIGALFFLNQNSVDGK